MFLEKINFRGAYLLFGAKIQKSKNYPLLETLLPIKRRWAIQGDMCADTLSFFDFWEFAWKRLFLEKTKDDWERLYLAERA